MSDKSTDAEIGFCCDHVNPLRVDTVNEYGQQQGSMPMIQKSALAFTILLLNLQSICSAESEQHRSATSGYRTMRVVVEQSGGFTGIPFTTSVDTGSMSPSDAAELQALVDSAHVAEFPKGGTKNVYPDQLEYTITLERDGERHEVNVSESDLSDPLRALLDWVRSRASE